jgi:hypothetical protein
MTLRDPQRRRHLRRQLLGWTVDLGLALIVALVIVAIMWSHPA